MSIHFIHFVYTTIIIKIQLPGINFFQIFISIKFNGVPHFHIWNKRFKLYYMITDWKPKLEMNDFFQTRNDLYLG